MELKLVSMLTEFECVVFSSNFKSSVMWTFSLDHVIRFHVIQELFQTGMRDRQTCA